MCKAVKTIFQSEDKGLSMSTSNMGNYVPFSQSTLWNMQGRFYKEAGINAWNKKIPYLITNNRTIVNSYANVIMRFFQEYSHSHPSGPGPNPFIIVELGAGSGMFAFYLIKQLLELRRSLNRPDLTFKYVMTDFSAKNIAFWRNHPALRQYVQYFDEAMLDFAEYAIGETSTLHLLESGLNLDHSTYGSEHPKPWVVIANYVFDTLPQDIFQVRDGNLLEGRTPETVPDSHAENSSQNEFKSFQQLGMSIEYRSINLPYYNNEHFDTILSYYKDTLPDRSFAFPITTLRGIHNLLHLSGQKLILLATDKASTRQPPIISEEWPMLVFHNASFSMKANFHAIRAFFQSIGGKALDQPIAESITTSLFFAGEGLKSLYETEQSFSTFLINYNPFGLLHFCWQLDRFINTYSTGELLSYLNLLRWDPEVINKYIKNIIAKMKELDPLELEPFIEGMRRCGDYFYYLPDSLSKLINVATFFEEIEDFATALEYYQQSVQYVEDKTSFTLKQISYKITMCHYRLKRQALLAGRNLPEDYLKEETSTLYQEAKSGHATSEEDTQA
jgi:hypothetical protein